MKVAGKPIAIIEAPSNLGLKPPAPGREPGTARAPDALRQAGLHKMLSPARVIRVEPPPYAADENRTVNVRNMAAIGEYSLKLADALEDCLARGEFPLVLGGDCSILLGNMLGLKRRGEPALLYIDGHTDLSPRTIGKWRSRGHGPSFRHRLGTGYSHQSRRTCSLCA